ncbi:MAG: sigma-54 dependent transcriptional regulator [Bdellovibrionota bacterium]
MEPAARVLIADDEQNLRLVLGKALEQQGHEVVLASDGDAALKELSGAPFDLAFLDIKMPGASGLEILSRVRERPDAPAIVIMTAQSTMANAVEAMKRGAFDYLTKPFDLGAAEALARRAIEARRKGLGALEGDEDVAPAERIVGRSAPMQEIYKLVGKVAASDAAVLITGESGTGKELIARTVHEHSRRAENPFVAVNMAAIPKELLESELFGHVKGAFTGATERRRGKFEIATGGTLFLDEIGEMPLEVQSKLLRALQEKEVNSVGAEKATLVDVRLIAATNADLSSLVKAGKFREDLYYRLNVIPLHVPPLRSRREDIALLVKHFLRVHGTAFEVKKEISPEAMELLQGYSFPGNVRELENIAKRALLTSPGALILADDVRPLLGGGGAAEDLADQGFEDVIAERIATLVDRLDLSHTRNLHEIALAAVERPLLRLLLDRTGGNQLKTAQILGINRNTLRKRLRQLGLLAEKMDKAEKVE